jgi:hypothetical protein
MVVRRRGAGQRNFHEPNWRIADFCMRYNYYDYCNSYYNCVCECIDLENKTLIVSKMKNMGFKLYIVFF